MFVSIHPEAGGLIITPKPIYDYLTSRGYQAKGEYLVVEGWPVQFLPPTGPLLEEAIAEAREADVEGERTFVISAVMWTDTSEFRNHNYHRRTDTPDMACSSRKPCRSTSFPPR